MPLYEAHLEYQTTAQRAARVAGDMKMLFEDDDYDAALASVFRWWHQRHAALGEVFDYLCAVKIYRIVPQRITADGTLSQDHGLACKEWKCDYPDAKHP